MSERKALRVRRLIWVGVAVAALLAAAVIQFVATQQTVRVANPAPVSDFMTTPFCGGAAPPDIVADSDVAAPATNASVDAQVGGEHRVDAGIGCGPRAD